MLAVYVGQNVVECSEVAQQLRGSKAPLRLAWARMAMELMTFDGPDQAMVILGSDLEPYERLKLINWLGLNPSMTAVALGEPVRGVPSVTLEQLSPRTLVERARPVVPPRLPLSVLPLAA